ncbi:alpha-pore-forming cytotoxin MakA [Pseudomonas huaxiensis]|uniref:alpha-pore-forming cytotoxin MakA n=1 Tax=Pseudomonas huaxiensis TaxID=2213017 RepID=UPI00130087E2|nr:non-hemolytic enterotoxin lytic component L1 [Pseudomonas huaxiensis]
MMNVALLDATAPNNLAPAPDTLIGNTGVSYNAAQLITFACHAVDNTVFVSPTPQPSWFDTLNGELGVAQTLAQQWIDTLGPDVSKTIPLQVIDFGSDFTAATNAILQIVQQNPTASGATNPYVIEVQTIIQQTLLPPIQAVITQMTQTNTDLVTWGNSMQTAHNNLVSGATNIQSAETQLQADIGQMNAAIAALNAEITQENQAIAASAAGIGIGIFALVVGVALAPETGGASLLVGGVIGAAGIIGGGVTWGVMQSKINDQFNQIAADQQELNDDQRQLVALQGLQMASDGAVASIELATQALSKLMTQWGTLQGELQGVVTQLQSAEAQLSTITEGIFTQAAVTEWTQAIATANNLVNAQVPIQSQTLPM